MKGEHRAAAAQPCARLDVSGTRRTREAVRPRPQRISWCEGAGDEAQDEEAERYHGHCRLRPCWMVTSPFVLVRMVTEEVKAAALTNRATKVRWRKGHLDN